MDSQYQLETQSPSDGPLFRCCIRYHSVNHSSRYHYECKSRNNGNLCSTSTFFLTNHMQSGPDGAEAGSKWACRETFVSIVVSNLPIIQPLLRKGFKKIGLSQLFSSSGKPSGQTYPLSGLKSLTNRGDRDTKKSKTNTAAPSHMQVSAWGSDEHILTEPEPSSKDITVVSETVVQSEPWSWEQPSGNHSTTPPKEWGGRSADR